SVVGHFSENHATALQCVYLTASGSGTNSGGFLIVANPTCGVGYTKTGSGCSHQSAGIPLTDVSPSFFNHCTWNNTAGGALSGSAYHADTVCCRVPGQYNLSQNVPSSART